MVIYNIGGFIAPRYTVHSSNLWHPNRQGINVEEALVLGFIQHLFRSVRNQEARRLGIEHTTREPDINHTVVPMRRFKSRHGTYVFALLCVIQKHTLVVQHPCIDESRQVVVQQFFLKPPRHSHRKPLL